MSLRAQEYPREGLSAVACWSAILEASIFAWKVTRTLDVRAAAARIPKFEYRFRITSGSKATDGTLTRSISLFPFAHLISLTILPSRPFSSVIFALSGRSLCLGRAHLLRLAWRVRIYLD